MAAGSRRRRSVHAVDHTDTGRALRGQSRTQPQLDRELRPERRARRRQHPLHGAGRQRRGHDVLVRLDEPCHDDRHLDRLPAGSDPMWLRFRLHWGELAVDATTVGGESSGLTVAGTTEDGYVLLALDKQTAKRVDEIRAGPMVAGAVFHDARRLLDA